MEVREDEGMKHSTGGSVLSAQGFLGVEILVHLSRPFHSSVSVISYYLPSILLYG